MGVSHAEIKIQNKHDLIQHAAQEKVATLTHFTNNVTAFLYTILTSNQALQKRKKAIYFLLIEEQNIQKILITLALEQLLANKHRKLPDSTFGGVGACLWSPTKLKKLRYVRD